MKAFEKWWQYNNYGKHRTPGPKEVWRAALEEVYNQLDYSQEHETIKDWIEKELNE